jgi:hypothetical protein
MHKIFISYSHHDEAWKDRLVPHFSALQKQGLLEVWDDREIETAPIGFRKLIKPPSRRGWRLS